MIHARSGWGRETAPLTPVRPAAGSCAGVPWARLLALTGLLLLAAQGAAAPVQAIRFAENPVIRPAMLPGANGKNINGPSLIRVPDWVPGRLGTYYLYFAHHSGRSIRLAYADDLHGPWTIHPPGVLDLKDAPGTVGHIASPDVIVDEASRQIRMYFHGQPKIDVKAQLSFVALSPDGLHFKASAEPLGLFYFRVFRGPDAWYALAKGGLLYRSLDGLTAFEQGHNPLPAGAARGAGDLHGNSPGPRHVAVQSEPGFVWIYYSSIGDAPERILRSRMALSGPWTAWQAGAAEEVLRPAMDYEGVALPVVPSKAGAAKGPEHALRDPAIFKDLDGRVYLIYSVAGETGLAIAELKETP